MVEGGSTPMTSRARSRHRTRPLRAGRIWSLSLLVLIVAPLAAVSSSTPSAHAASTRPHSAVTAPLDRGEPLAPGTLAVVRADGDCLRLRDAPSLGGERLICIPEGTVVRVLTGNVEADGHRWIQVEFDGQIGWAANDFLEAHFGAPACEQATAGPPPGLTGSVPTNGGFGLAQWGGGRAEGIINTALDRGCPLVSIWATFAGELVGYIVGAPDFVNADWSSRFPNGDIPNGTIVLLRCETATGQAIARLPIPAATAAAPLLATNVPPPDISARAAIVIDDASGAVLFDEGGHQALPPASLTKIATAILAIEGSDVTGWARSNVDARQLVGSTVMGLRPGDCFLVQDLLYGLMLNSGNDAAIAIAEHQAGTVDAFVDQMNTLLVRLGLTDSHFSDPHGLGDDEHIASPHDLAMLARYAMRLPGFADIVATSARTVEGSRTIQLRNLNRFLTRYDGADGVKTGFTEEAGRTLVASAVRDGHRLFAVMLNDDFRFTDAAALFDWAFANYEWPD
jgi:D-alanyl-D-alanine carboxypeptidase